MSFRFWWFEVLLLDFSTLLYVGSSLCLLFILTEFSYQWGARVCLCICVYTLDVQNCVFVCVCVFAHRVNDSNPAEFD